MAGLFDDLTPTAPAQGPVYGEGSAYSGQAAPAPQGASAYVQSRDLTAPVGSQGNPSFDTPDLTGADNTYHIDQQGGLHAPKAEVNVGMFGDLIPGQGAPKQDALASDPSSQVSGFMANLNRGLGVGDEAAAAAGVVRDLATGYARFGTDKPGNVFSNNLGMLRDTYNLEMAKQRGNEDGFNAEHPHLAALARGTGMAAPLLFSGGAAAPELAAGRIGAIAKGATAGGAAAYGYGLTDRGTALERIEAANKAILPGMALGGVFGAFAPVVKTVPENAPSLADHAAIGVDPMAAVNGSPDLQRIGQILKGIPLAGAPLVKAADRTAGQLDAGVQRIGASLGEATDPLTSGVALQRGAKGAVDFYKGATSEVYKPVNALEANQTPIPVANTQGAIGEMFARYPTIPDWLKKQAPALVQVQETLNGAGGKLTFGELKSMRGDIGKMLDNRATLGGIDQARLKQVYGAMSDDLSAGAGQLGGPEAQQALSRADTYNAAVRTRVADTLDTILQAKSPEDAYGKVVAMAGSTARGDLQQLGRLKRSLDPEAWNEFSSGVVHQLGRDPNGNFSPAKFATAWNKLRPEGKKALFGDQVEDLDAASRIAGMQTAAGKFYNHSGSGSHAITAMALLEPAEEAVRHLGAGEVGQAMASVSAPAAIAALGNGAARLLASPGIGRAIVTAQMNPTIAPQIMEAYAANNPSVAALARTFGARLQQGLSRGVAGVSASVPSQQSR